MNQKGFYNDDKEWTKKLKDFLKESGFYILVVIGLCVLAVGAVYFTTNHLITSPDQFEEDLVPDGASTENNNDEIAIIDDDAVDKAAIDEFACVFCLALVIPVVDCRYDYEWLVC